MTFYRTPVDSTLIDGGRIVWLDCGHARPGAYRRRDTKPTIVVRRGRLSARMFCRACWKAGR